MRVKSGIMILPCVFISLIERIVVIWSPQKGETDHCPQADDNHGHVKCLTVWREKTLWGEILTEMRVIIIHLHGRESIHVLQMHSPYTLSFYRVHRSHWNGVHSICFTWNVCQTVPGLFFCGFFKIALVTHLDVATWIITVKCFTTGTVKIA